MMRILLSLMVRSLPRCISDTERDGEWPEIHKKTVIPYSLFNEDTIMGLKSQSKKRKKDIGLSDLDPFPHFDLVIVDEAHTIRNPDTWMYMGGFSVLPECRRRCIADSNARAE